MEPEHSRPRPGESWKPTPPSDPTAWWAGVAGRSPLPMAVTDGDQHIVRYANHAFEEAAGAPEDAIVGRALDTSMPAAEAAALSEMLDRVYTTGIAETRADSRSTALGPGGTAIYTVWPVLDHEDRPSGLLVQLARTTRDDPPHEETPTSRDDLLDVNRRLVLAGLAADEQAEHAERRVTRFNSLIANLADGVVVLDATMGTLLVNPAARAIWGLPDGARDLESGDAELRSVAGDPVEHDRWPTRRALRGERFTDEEYALYRDGQVLHITCSGSHSTDEQGNIDLAMVTIRDVTEVRRLEQFREEYAALISHDLRAPLTVVTGQVHRLRRHLERAGVLDDRSSEAIEDIEGASTRMRLLIEDMLDSGYLRAGQALPDRELVDIANLVESARDLVDDEGRIVFEGPRRTAMVLADGPRIGRVLANLLSNALKYSPPDAPVTVSVARRRNEVVISVTDRGVGISPEHVPNLFSRYYRVMTGEPGAGNRGYGLGLYISRIIVEAHGGRIWVESEPGAGSTFRFSLPAAPAAGR